MNNYPIVISEAETPSAVTPSDLKKKVIKSLAKQGFKVSKGIITPPEQTNKDILRPLHEASVAHAVEKAKPYLQRYENKLLTYIASGPELAPEKIKPVLVEVSPRTEEELLFRYVRLHWSIPVSAGYGRRIRFLVYDEYNGKLMGLFGLGDPVYGLKARDKWIGWNQERKREKLKSVMDLFVLGSVPPYSFLLGGKLIALLTTCIEVQKTFERKYAGTETTIRKQTIDKHLALLTTTSALGRSSLYNRLIYNDQKVFQSVGYTNGSGEFHFSNGLYAELRDFALSNCTPTSKNVEWGTGFRNKRELLRKVLPLLGLSADLLYHGVQREIFVVPLGINTRNYLQGNTKYFRPYEWSVEELFHWYRERWLITRAKNNAQYSSYNSENYRLWYQR